MPSFAIVLVLPGSVLSAASGLLHAANAGSDRYPPQEQAVLQRFRRTWASTRRRCAAVPPHWSWLMGGERVDLLLNCGYIDMRIKHGGAGRALRVRVTHAGLGGGCLDSAG